MLLDAGELESVEDFAARARGWLAANMPRASEESRGLRAAPRSDDEELARIARCRELQRMLFDGGYAGIAVPRAYGGQGLTSAHQRAFNREIGGYEYPADTQVPTFCPCMAVILEFGTEEQKQRHVPPMLKGEAFWMQFLSEPSGGSDLAGALTSAVRDGDEWVLNGSKIWTTGAWWADWALCLARTNWDVSKHRGLSVFMVEIRQPGVEVHRIEMLNGSREFCQEFMTDVRVSDSLRIGPVDEGWRVVTRWMYHERTISSGSPLVTAPAGRPAVALDPTGTADAMLAWARRQGRLGDPRVQELIGESRALALVGDALSERLGEQIRSGAANEQAAAINRLWFGTAAVRNSTIWFDLMGPGAVAWSDDGGGARSDDGGGASSEDEALGGQKGIRFLMRQSSCIAGGTTEMSRNAISERVLGLPREPSPDRDVPFRDVPRGHTTQR
jgi:alkylation response protein AidB-like acyl-CoA dehydrogenase